MESQQPPTRRAPQAAADPPSSSILIPFLSVIAIAAFVTLSLSLSPRKCHAIFVVLFPVIAINISFLGHSRVTPALLI